MKVKEMKYVCLLFVCLLLFIIACKKEKKEEAIDCSGVSPSYVSEVKPIVNANCLSSGCHNAGSANGDYTTYNGLKAVASSGALESRAVTNKTMPPSGALSLADRKKIKCWVSSGALNN